ncbi:hypothetical protein D9756_003108 [Leucocoprinus leucothites]|uniref:DNA2/NAM7 helicase-like C-terminal domain-containing protein n=1 Tax=Leucocoprinus leucothites TaxID=201217 RepID=A0A8H5LJA2_9AGAR|nr:hypothetical protein D9756_003108 [Leucoagaricus leucothites]
MSSTSQTITLKQKILPGCKGNITARFVHMNDLSQQTLDKFLSSAVDSKIGIAPSYDTKQTLISIAFATRDQVLVLKVATKNFNSTIAVGKRKLLGSRIFLNPDFSKYAFHMDKLCTSLFLDLELHIVGAVDILSCLPRGRHLFLTKIEALGGEPTVDGSAVKDLFREDETFKAERTVIATQAWAAYQAALLCPAEACKIDTTILSTEGLTFVAKTTRAAEQLTALQPLVSPNDIDNDYSVHKGQLLARSSRFSTRVKDLSSNQRIRVEFSTPSGPKVLYQKKLGHVNGRSVQVALASGTSSARKVKLFTEGRDDPTAAEALRTNTLLGVLKNQSTFLTLPFVKEIWFPDEGLTRSSKSVFNVPGLVNFKGRTLNRSQLEAVDAILSDEPNRRILLIQGPPGTGKTTVIAAAVIGTVTSLTNSTVWLVAQSNVAVKNIAEKLADVDFLDFKLLVSKDFHYDWHEHLYEEIIHNVIRSDDFPPYPVAAERRLAGSRVILCTLSMLCNDRISVFTRLVPPTVFIFDEASQIEVGGYVPMLHRFQKTMQKLVFIGDDKQLPPYGQSDVEGLQSVFELSHLRSRALFLDTQYRMPLVIGDVISKEVYDRRLKSLHAISAKTCCQFVNVTNGRERRQGKSWTNVEQSKIAITIAGKMEKLGYSYRIISPYDAQRSLMENSLKDAKLDWKDKVFNVDSFQGNEDDYIIICLVRTDRVGFLKDMRRVNVMLTRCKKGMVICTDKSFLRGVAKNSLVAKLANTVGNGAWVHWQSVIQPSFHPFPTVH